MPRNLTVPVPPNFDEEQWSLELPPPRGYKGVEFDFDTVALMIRQSRTVNRIIILDTSLPVTNLQLQAPPRDPAHPLYFEVAGTYRYAFSIWVDRFCIEIWSDSEPKSCMFPATVDELQRALQTIVADCS